jgi:hypothetical protein
VSHCYAECHIVMLNVVTLSVTLLCIVSHCYAECHIVMLSSHCYAGCHIVMLSVIMLSVRVPGKAGERFSFIVSLCHCAFNSSAVCVLVHLPKPATSSLV